MQHWQRRRRTTQPPPGPCRDGATLDAERNWVLADARHTTVLVYSLAGEGVRLARLLAGGPYQGLWFDPRTGRTMEAQLPAQLDEGAWIGKPDGREWLLVLRAQAFRG